MAERFIVLPKLGLRARTQNEIDVLTSFPTVRSTGPANERYINNSITSGNLRVIDTVAENGPKLIELSPQDVLEASRPDSPVRLVPEVFYKLPEPQFSEMLVEPAAAAGVSTFDVEVLDSQTNSPIAGCDVRAYSHLGRNEGVSGITGANGRVRLSLPVNTIDCVMALPAPGTGYWSAYRRSVPASGVIQLKATPVRVPYADSVQHYYSYSNFNAATGVVVGVVDTGCGPHNDLNITGGRNTVTGEPASAFTDGHYHGTHVAGLVGARGQSSARGIAPGIPIRSYRVFGAGARGASNYAIMKALILAADDKCDILNLSLGGGPHNVIVEEAILDARNQGMLVVIAAGNGGRQPVSFPAAYTGATAVAAMGRLGTIPAGATEELKALRPPSGTDPQEFIADFSNIGPQIDVVAPGVGTVSTLPNNRIGPLSGTSMAAPVVAGAAACLLSQNASIHTMPRDRQRSDTIEKLLQTSCVKRNFAPNGLSYEGFGMPTV